MGAKVSSCTLVHPHPPSLLPRLPLMILHRPLMAVEQLHDLPLPHPAPSLPPSALSVMIAGPSCRSAAFAELGLRGEQLAWSSFSGSSIRNRDFLRNFHF